MNTVFQFFDDMLKSVYDLKFMANVISKKSLKQVFLALAFISLVYGLILGAHYTKIFQDFSSVIKAEVIRQLPDFKIRDGELTSPVAQPYIFTLGDLSEDFFKDLDAWGDKWSKNGTSNVRTLKSGLKYFLMSADGTEATLALVIDTTNTYKAKIDPNKFKEFMLFEKNKFYYRSRNGAEKEFYFKDSKVGTVEFTAANLGPAIDKMVSGLQGIVIPFFIVMIFVQFLVRAAFISLLGLLLVRIVKKPLTYKNIYAIAVYSLLPVIIVGIVHNFIMGLVPVVSLTIYSGYVACGIVFNGKKETAE